MGEASTRLRADARRNRDLILAAAKSVFTELGPDAPMEVIARAANVGVGTLYRRFADREALIRAVARENFADVLAAVHAAVAEESSSWHTLVRIVSQSRDLRLSVQLAMLSPLAGTAIDNDPYITDYRQALVGALERVVKTAQAEGALRRDVGTGDVIALFTLLLRQFPWRPEQTPALMAERCMMLMLDGLRAPGGSELPGRGVTRADLAL